MRKNKIRILHVAQAAGGVDRYIRMLLKYLDKEKFENILVCSQDFHEEDYKGLLDSFEQIEMTRAIGRTDLKAIKEVRALIKKYNPDIVYAHSSKAGAIARVADIGIKNCCVCLQSNDAIKVVCIDTPHIASNKNKIKASLYGIWNRKAKTEFAKLLLDLDPKHTVIHIHGWSKALSVSVVAVAQNMHFPVLITLHDYFAVCPNGGFFNYQKKELCHLEPMSWKCISCNCDKRSYFQKIWRCMRQSVQNRYVKNAKDIHFAYISNRILTLSQPYLKSTKFHYLRNPIDLSDQMVMNHHCSNIYLCAGRVSEEKGVEDFCKAITEVQKNVDIRGQVVGVGPLVDTLKQKYPKIEFVGWVNSVQLTKYYQTARALVFPSICNEGSPLTIPEALSAGLPCIVTDCTSATETITDGINGLIYDTGNVEALKQKIRISLEDTVIDRFQKNIRDSFKCADYSYATYVVQVNRLYDSILMEEQER